VTIVWRKRDRELRRKLSAGSFFSGADLHRARLVGMDLRRKSLNGANLEYADLTEADLGGADLRDANLHGAYLIGARFGGADLRGANLVEAYALATEFEDAELEGADLTGVVYDQSTTWPQGIRPPRDDVGMRHGRRPAAAEAAVEDIVEVGYVPLWCSELILTRLRDAGIRATASEEHARAGYGQWMARVFCGADRADEAREIIDDVTTD
jgi:hypothetical protein